MYETNWNETNELNNFPKLALQHLDNKYYVKRNKNILNIFLISTNV